MSEHFIQFYNNFSISNLNIILLLGFALFGGTIGGRIFQKLRIPQVVGYIIIGVVLGQSGFKIIDKALLNDLQPFNYFALGLIGFMVGGELKKKVVFKYGKQFVYILLFEGLTAFFFVSIISIIIASFFLDIRTSIALGLLLGAISSATAPAATTDVLWEYKTKGPLTTTILGIVAMDDGLSLMLFAIASSIAISLLGTNSETISKLIFSPIYEIFGALILGSLSGLLLSRLLKKYTEEDRILAFSLGMVMLVLGFSLVLNVDMLLSAMALGTMIVNYSPYKSKKIFDLVGKFTPPIYVLFFVLFGAKLSMKSLNLFMGLLAIFYLLGRTGGKMIGAWIGAKLSQAPTSIRKYLPFCLFSQAGVAIGLSILAGQKFNDAFLGNAIVIVITTTTFVVQLLGPPFTKYAVVKAGEAGLNITEKDLIEKSRAKDLMETNVPVVRENMPLRDILKTFSKSNALYFPVVNKDNQISGIITIEEIKNTFMSKVLNQFLIAIDIMHPLKGVVHPDTPILSVLDILRKNNLNYLPVVDENNKLLGYLDHREIQRHISKKIMAMHKKAYELT